MDDEGLSEAGYNEKVERFFRGARYEEALAAAKEAVEKFPESSEVWNNYGVLQFQLGNLDGASESLERALSLDGQSADALHNTEKVKAAANAGIAAEMIERPVFICGTGRSGTTILALMLDSHPNLVSGPEIKLLQLTSDLYRVIKDNLMGILAEYEFGEQELDLSFRRFISSFFMKRSVSGRVVEQTPLNILNIRQLSRIFPDGQFLHIIRDGRDVVCSLLKRKWIDVMTGIPFGPSENFENAATYWATTVRTAGDEARTFLDESMYLAFHYEELVRSTEGTLRKVLEFLGEPFEKAVLEYFKQPHTFATDTPGSQKGMYDRAISRWKKEFTAEDAEKFDSIAGDLLVELEYEENREWVKSFSVNKEE